MKLQRPLAVIRTKPRERRTGFPSDVKCELSRVKRQMDITTLPSYQLVGLVIGSVGKLVKCI